MSTHLVTGYAGKAHIKAANHGAYNAATVGTRQYVLDFGTMFEASVLSANKIGIYDGILLNQGRQIQIDPNTYEEVDIENGAQGYMRNDIIAMRYSKNAETDVESASLVVIKGTSAETNPIDPECVSGDIINGAVVSDMPLYRVPLDGLTVGELVPLFDVKPSQDNMFISDLVEMTAITEEGKYAADAKAVGELFGKLVKVKVKEYTVVTGNSVGVGNMYEGSVSTKSDKPSGTVLATFCCPRGYKAYANGSSIGASINGDTLHVGTPSASQTCMVRVIWLYV